MVARCMLYQRVGIRGIWIELERPLEPTFRPGPIPIEPALDSGEINVRFGERFIDLKRRHRGRPGS